MKVIKNNHCNKQSKTDFITEISKMTPVELNELIKSKGKKPKLTEAIIYSRIDWAYNV